MKSSDLKYIYENIPYKEMNIYKDIKSLNTAIQYIHKAEELGFKHRVKPLKKGHKQLNLLRKNGTLAGVIRNPIYPTNSLIGRQASISKMQTESILTAVGISTTVSRMYHIDDVKKAKSDWFDESNETVVIKPNNMSQGKGVYVHIAENEFEKYWDLTSNLMRKHKNKPVDILVQKFIPGFEARATIIEGKFNSIVARVPAFIVGDGKNNIKDLIEIKNKKRLECAHLKKKLIKPDVSVESFIKQSGYTFESVPDKDEYVLLISVSNTSLGGEMVDITDVVSKEIKDIAINALASLPDMNSGGVDIMMKDFNDTNPSVIEINQFPLLQSTIYPTYGPSTDPQAYYLKAFYTRDKILNNLDNGYIIDQHDDILQNYFKFKEKQNEFQAKLYKHMMNI